MIGNRAARKTITSIRDPETHLSSRIRRCFGCETVAERVFSDDARKHEIEQVVSSAGFRSSSGHLVPAEWVSPHDGTGDGAIDIEVSDLKLRTDAFDVLRAP